MLGEVKIHELKPGGEDILVTEENKVPTELVEICNRCVLYCSG